MSRSARRREQREKRAELIASGTWVPQPPVGHLPLLHRVRADIIPVIAADIGRGKRRTPRIHQVAISD